MRYAGFKRAEGVLLGLMVTEQIALTGYRDAEEDNGERKDWYGDEQYRTKPPDLQSISLMSQLPEVLT